MIRVEIDDEALAEALDAREYYAAVRPDLGRDFAEALDRAVTRIVSHSDAWPPYTARTRRYLMDRFPYSLVYRVEGELIRIVAVAHHHRRPGYWKKRLR